MFLTSAFPFKRSNSVFSNINRTTSFKASVVIPIFQYETARTIRNYIDAVRKNPNCPDNNPEWIEWANKKADWLDPIICREDELFGKRKHELDTTQKEQNDTDGSFNCIDF